LRWFWKDRLILFFCWSAAIFLGMVITVIGVYLGWKGIRCLNWEFIWDMPKGTPLGKEGGIYPALKGTLYLVFFSILFSFPLALITALHISCYGTGSRWGEFINLAIQTMSGNPSIVTGLFGYSLFVVSLGYGISLLSGSLTLGIMVFPVMVITFREALLAARERFMLVALSLGVSPWYLFRRVILPWAWPHIAGGTLLAMGYAAGATAPIMVTAVALFSPTTGSLREPVMALPYHISILFSQHISLEKASGTALVLLILLLLINLTAMLIGAFKRDLACLVWISPCVEGHKSDISL